MEDTRPFCEATDTPVSDLWWRLPLVSKAGWSRLHAFLPCAPLLRFTSGVTPAGHLVAGMMARRIPYMLSFHFAEVGCQSSNGWSPDQCTDAPPTRPPRSLSCTLKFLLNTRKIENYHFPFYDVKKQTSKIKINLYSWILEGTYQYIE